MGDKDSYERSMHKDFELLTFHHEHIHHRWN